MVNTCGTDPQGELYEVQLLQLRSGSSLPKLLRHKNIAYALHTAHLAGDQELDSAISAATRPGLPLRQLEDALEQAGSAMDYRILYEEAARLSR